MRHTAGSVDADRARQRPALTAKAPQRDTCRSGAACVELRKNEASGSKETLAVGRELRQCRETTVSRRGKAQESCA
jgi:hypothetical protein